MYIYMEYAPEKTNISSENWWSVQMFSFRKPALFRDMLIFYGVSHSTRLIGFFGIPIKGVFKNPYKRGLYDPDDTKRLGVFCCLTWVERRRFGTSWYGHQSGSERGVIVKPELSIESEIMWDRTGRFWEIIVSTFIFAYFRLDFKFVTARGELQKQPGFGGQPEPTPPHGMSLSKTPGPQQLLR